MGPEFLRARRRGPQLGGRRLLPKALLQSGSWETVNVKRAFSVCMRAILGAFYSHPWAWNEIGFGGPAYPGIHATRSPGGS